MDDGSWEPNHEHNWLLRVTVQAAELDDKGFVVDFLKLQAVMNGVIERYEGRCFNDVPPFDGPRIPTAECIAHEIYLSIAPHIDDERVCLSRIDLREAPTSWATFLATS
jgi:6-pyruvoyltetrahydropterin/6-carboxytetrahydropterin synthase